MVLVLIRIIKYMKKTKLGFGWIINNCLYNLLKLLLWIVKKIKIAGSVKPFENIDFMNINNDIMVL